MEVRGFVFFNLLSDYKNNTWSVFFVFKIRCLETCSLESGHFPKPQSPAVSMGIAWRVFQHFLKKTKWDYLAHSSITCVPPFKHTS